MSFSWAKPYEPKTALGRWFDERLPLPRLAYGAVGGGYPVPRNLNYFWNFGVLAGVFLTIQIVTGIVLAMWYFSSVDGAFNSVEHIMRDVNSGWLIRYAHMNGASFFFIVTYIHIFRGLYYGSYKAPRELVWMLGLVIYLLMMATAFMGYVLPWGQMSYWGAQVITGFFSAFPLVGPGASFARGRSPIPRRSRWAPHPSGISGGRIALAVVLLSASGLLIRSFQRVQATDRGFDSRNVLLLQVDLPRTYNSREKATAYFAAAMQRIRALPGARRGRARSVISSYTGSRTSASRSRDSRPAVPKTPRLRSPRIRWFPGISKRCGSHFCGAGCSATRTSRPTRRRWRSSTNKWRSVSGRVRIPSTNVCNTGWFAANRPWITVVGVVANMRRQRLDEAAIPYMFHPGVSGQMDLAVRTVGDPERLREAIRTEMKALDPTVPPYGVVTVEHRLGRQ